MASIILSIHKQYCDLLFSGRKQFEFRKSIPSRPVSSIFVYEARGCGKIIGELKLSKVLVGTPDEIWNQTNRLAGIDKASFLSYFNGKDKAVAYVIGDYIRYESPKQLSDFGISRPPQNYIWVKE